MSVHMSVPISVHIYVHMCTYRRCLVLFQLDCGRLWVGQGMLRRCRGRAAVRTSGAHPAHHQRAFEIQDRGTRAPKVGRTFNA